MAGLLVVSLAPNFRPAGRLLGAWPNSTDFSYATPRLSLGFVDDPLWQRLMAPGSTVLVLPTGDATSAGFWQAESDMRFALAVPGTPFVPPALLGEPVMQGLLSNHLARLEGTSLATARLRAYLRANHVAIVAVTHAGARRWQRLAALATATRPWIVGSTTLYRVPADLKPLHLTGERRIVRKPGAVLSAWLAFDGTRARVCVRYRSHPGRPAKVTILSAPAADADSLHAALGPSGRVAVAFTQYITGEVQLRFATRAKGHWRITTLDRSNEGISNLRMVILPGAVVLSWIDAHDPMMIVRTIAIVPGRVSRVVTLDETPDAEGVALRAVGKHAVVAFADALASESRLRAVIFNGRRWGSPTIVADSMWPISHVAASVRRGLPVVYWVLRPLLGRPLDFAAGLAAHGWTAKLVHTAARKAARRHHGLRQGSPRPPHGHVVRHTIGETVERLTAS